MLLASLQVGACLSTKFASRFCFALLVLATLALMLSNATASTGRTTVDVQIYWGTPYAGTPVSMRVRYSNADSLWVEPGVGALPIRSSGETRFLMTFQDTTIVRAYVRNETNSSIDEIVINPRLPEISIFNGWPDAVPPGRNVALATVIYGATHARIEPQVGTIPGSGEYYATVESTTVFTLFATNPMGTVTATDTITISPPFIDDYRVAPTEIVPGEAARFDWIVYFADSLSVVGPEGIEFTSTEFPYGSTELSPTVTSDFVLEAYNIAGTSLDTLTVTVSPVIIRRFEADSPRSPPGGAVWLSWDVAGVGEVSISGLGNFDLQDSVLVFPDATTTYELSARSESYVTAQELTVEITYAPPDYIALSWADSTLPGQRPDIVAGVEFDVFVLALSPSWGLYAYEFGLKIPAGFRLVDSEAFPIGAGVSVGEEPSWVVGTGSCYGKHQEYVPLLRVTLRYDGGNKLPTSANLKITGSTPSTFANNEPGYYNCIEELHPFDILEVFDLMKPTTRVPVLSFGLALDPMDSGVRIRWDLNATQAPDEIDLVRRDGRHGERVLARWTGADARLVGSFVDAEAPRPGTSYLLRVELGGTWTESEPLLATASITPSRTRLLPNVPNPFNPATELRFALAKRSRARLEIYDTAGRRITELRSGVLDPGEHALTWNARDRSGAAVSSGVYLVRLITSDAQDQRRILLLK
jgi:FlgD Ig-like domain